MSTRIANAVIAPWVAAGILLLTACSNFTVDSDYTPETDFDAFKTYTWYSAKLRDPASLEYLGGETARRIMAAHGYGAP